MHIEIGGSLWYSETCLNDHALAYSSRLPTTATSRGPERDAVILYTDAYLPIVTIVL